MIARSSLFDTFHGKLVNGVSAPRLRVSGTSCIQLVLGGKQTKHGARSSGDIGHGPDFWCKWPGTFVVWVGALEGNVI